MTFWEKQWKLFAPGFKEGKAHIDLAPYGASHTILLHPGPGFGDCSHSTTRLMLTLMAPHLPGQPVIDIGCGSGILSLAAAALGAKSVYGYDIDLDAVSHAAKNGMLNQSPAIFKHTPPSQVPSQSIVLMNMIFSEQKQAWAAFLPSLTLPTRLFTSGVLDSHRLDYLAWAHTNQWSIIQELREAGWWAFEFKL